MGYMNRATERLLAPGLWRPYIPCFFIRRATNSAGQPGRLTDALRRTRENGETRSGACAGRRTSLLLSCCGDNKEGGLCPTRTTIRMYTLYGQKSRVIKDMRKRSVFSVNIAVLLFGLAGLFAKWIHLPAICIAFGRILFSATALGIYLMIRRQSLRLVNKRDAILLLFAGMILALHWWSFLESIQLSTVAIGTITFSSFPLFVTFFEPLIFHQRLERRNIALAIAILIGVFITIPEFSFESSMFLGILIGMVSALSYAILTIMNKGFAGKYSGSLTAFYEQATAAVVLLPFVISVRAQPSASDLMLLLSLGIITTALAHTLFITSLKTLPAQFAGICSSLETVYGILFALLFLGEIPTIREIIGAAIIIGAVITAQA